MAVLAGDALLTYAFEYIATHSKGAAAERILEVVARLGKAVGAAGLVGGQIVDLASEGTIVDEKTLTFIHMHKTAALLEVSVTSGALLAGATPSTVDQLSRYAQRIGLAFQIVDDILDFTGSSEVLGKPAGSDLKSGNLTAPVLYALEETPYLAGLIEREFAEADDFEQAIGLIHKSDGIARSRDLATQHIDRAIACLQDLPSSEPQKALVELGSYVLRRVY